MTAFYVAMGVLVGIGLVALVWCWWTIPARRPEEDNTMK